MNSSAIVSSLDMDVRPFKPILANTTGPHASLLSSRLVSSRLDSLCFAFHSIIGAMMRVTGSDGSDASADRQSSLLSSAFKGRRSCIDSLQSTLRWDALVADLPVTVIDPLQLDCFMLQIGVNHPWKFVTARPHSCTGTNLRKDLMARPLWPLVAW
jgi:hypothetical protein